MRQSTGLRSAGLRPMDIACNLGNCYKQDMVGGSISRWDIFKDSANQNAIWLGDKAQKVWMATGYVLSELKNVYPR